MEQRELNQNNNDIEYLFTNTYGFNSKYGLFVE